MINTETKVLTKLVEGFEVHMVYKFRAPYYSADSRAGKISNAKETAVYINGEDMCAVSGWVSHEKAFEEARLQMQGTKWEF